MHVLCGKETRALGGHLRYERICQFVQELVQKKKKLESKSG